MFNSRTHNLAVDENISGGANNSGGGEFAGWPLDHAQIDILKIKLNPLLLGEGVRLFGNSVKNFTLELLDTALYDQGLQIITYKIKY